MAEEQKKKQKEEEEINVNQIIKDKLQKWNKDVASEENVLSILLDTFFKSMGYIRITTTILDDFLKEFSKNYDEEILPNIDENKSKKLKNLKGFTKTLFKNLLNDSLKELIDKEEKTTIKSSKKENNNKNNNEWKKNTKGTIETEPEEIDDDDIDWWDTFTAMRYISFYICCILRISALYMIYKSYITHIYMTYIHTQREKNTNIIKCKSCKMESFNLLYENRK